MKPDLYWVTELDPFRIAIASRPRGDEWLVDEILGLQREGVACVVSLLESQEIAEFKLEREGALCAAHRIKFRSFPIPDRGVPSNPLQFFALADEIARDVRECRAVAIHCRAGIGRSALLAGVVLLRLGIDRAQVFPMLSRARGLSVPDTAEQAAWFLATPALRANEPADVGKCA